MRMAQVATTTVYIAGLSLFAGTACVDHEGQSRLLTRDSAGITIVESRAPAWGEETEWVVEGQALLDLARSGQETVHEFFGATDATRLADGTLVVADDGTDEIRLFTPAGVHIKTLGRAGDGPGEFRRLSQVIALPGDSILAYDYWQTRITVFGPEGEMSRISHIEGAYRPRPLFPLADGGFVGQSMDFTGFREEVGLHRMASPIVLVGDDGTVTDTLTIVPGLESVVFSKGDAWALWGKNAHLTVHRDDIYVGAADSVEYKVYSSGGLDRIVRVPGYDLTLSREDTQAEHTAYLPDPSEASPVVREIMDLQPKRSHRPAYSDMVVDVQGNVWLQLYQGRHELSEPTKWLTFDSAGQWLGSVTLPARFHVFRVGRDWILGKVPDELDVEHIQLLGLSRDASDGGARAGR